MTHRGRIEAKAKTKAQKEWVAKQRAFTKGAGVDR